MPKEFHQWASDMSNSIEDKSNFIKPNAAREVLAWVEAKIQATEEHFPKVELDIGYVWALKDVQEKIKEALK